MSETGDLAPMREQVYADPRPKEYFDGFHERLGCSRTIVCYSRH